MKGAVCKSTSSGAPGCENKFQKLNKYLWVCSCKLSESGGWVPVAEIDVRVRYIFHIRSIIWLPEVLPWQDEISCLARHWLGDAGEG